MDLAVDYLFILCYTKFVRLHVKGSRRHDKIKDLSEILENVKSESSYGYLYYEYWEVSIRLRVPGKMRWINTQYYAGNAFEVR